MEESFQITIQIVIAVLAGISAQVVGEYFKLPSIVFLLLFGILLGSDALNILHPHNLGVGLEVLVALSVAIILFEGGLNLELRELGKVSGSLRNLVTIGTLITLVGGGMAAHWLAEFPWSIAFLYASLVVVTGPTVIGPILKQVSVDRQVATLLEGEGVLIDPVGAILAVVVLNTILNTNAAPLDIMSGLLLRLGIGGLVGGLGGWLLGLLLKQANSISEELKNLVVLAAVWGLFGLSESLRSESGLMATVVAGIVVKASAIPEERLLKRFKGQLTVLCVSVLFILLAADLSIASVFALGWGGAAIKALVFLTIMMTVFFQGLTAGWIANWLQITSSNAKGAVIIGCNGLGRFMGRLFQRLGESVVMIDVDPEACQKAEVDNLPVFQSSALDTEVLVEAGIESMGTFLALTNNGEVNLVLAQRAIEEFQPPRVLAAFPQNNSPESSSKIKVSQALIPQLPVKIWNSYIDDGQIKLIRTVLKELDFSLKSAHLAALIRGGEMLPLLVKRGENIQVAVAAEEWQANDEIYYLIHDPRPKLLKRLSGGNQSSRLLLEKLPEVEEIPLPEIIPQPSPEKI